MPNSLYHSVMPLWSLLLPNLGRIIDKAEAHCLETGMAATELLEARLAPDMWDFATQVHSAVVSSAHALEGAMTGDLVVTFKDPPSGFAALKTEVMDAADAVSAIDASALQARYGHDVVVHAGEESWTFLAEDFLVTYALPNFAFHVTTAYDILRMKGLALNKMDFLGPLRFKN